MKGHTFSELLLLRGRFASTVERFAKEQEKLLCKEVYLYLVSTQLARVSGMKPCEQTENAPFGCVRYDHDVSIQNNFVIFRKDCMSKLIVLEMVWL